MQKSLRGLSCRISALLIIALFTSCGKSDESILPVVHKHLQRHPDMQVEDIYKLVYQAAMGNDHSVTDTAAARFNLLMEFDEVLADSSEPLVEPLSPDGRIVRINLRPYKAGQGDVNLLYFAMIRSSHFLRPSSERLDTWLDEIVEESEYGTIPVDKGTLKTYFAQKRADGFPAVEHSETYETLYAPSYRVVMSELVPAL